MEFATNNKYAKKPYEYQRWNVNELGPITFSTWSVKGPDVQIGTKKHAVMYKQLYCGFDIETTTFNKGLACMYIWQFTLGHRVIKGRTWDEFIHLLDMLQNCYKLDEKHRLIIWVANLSFEWQWMRKWLNVTDYFFKSDRQPLYVTHNGCIEFRECLTISGGSLATLAKTFTNTQKALGDLDYKLKRHPMTPITKDEEVYCDNDVLILSEWSEYMFNHYMIPHHYLPLTIQGVIRHMIHEGCRRFWLSKYPDTKNMSKVIAFNQPTKEEYDLWARYLFRGGFVHGLVDYAGMIVKAFGSDLTSDYPSQMFERMPGKFTERDIEFMQQGYIASILDEDIRRGRHFIIEVEFIDLRERWSHSIESKSKCMLLDGGIIDNGRVRACHHMRVLLTELDMHNYKRFYTWSKMKIRRLWEADSMYLPNWVVRPMIDAYIKKAELKKAGENYDVEKSIVNSFYGVMCTRLNEQEIVYADGEYQHEPAKPYEKQMSKRELLFQWSIYITAWARHRQLEELYTCCKNGYEVYYGDTDSLKHQDGCEWIFKQANKRIGKKIRTRAEQRGLWNEHLSDLGQWDDEGKMFKMKYLGAKRYIYTCYDDGRYKFKQTVAGLPKGAMMKEYGSIDECFKRFENGLSIEVSGKLTSYHLDEEVREYVTDYQGNEYEICEKSALALVDAPFTLNLDGAFMNLIEEVQAEYETKEKR